MGAFLCFFHIKAGFALNNFALEINVVLKHFFKRQNLRLAVYYCNEVCAKGGLKLGISKNFVKHYLRADVFFQIDNNSYAAVAL